MGNMHKFPNKTKPARTLNPLLVQDYVYAHFIQVGSPIVDKTAPILNLITSGEGPYFLARPRRFGKSFLLDTIEIIFSGRPEFFKRFDIAKKKHKYAWECLPVIKLDMVDAGDSADRIEESLLQTVLEIADDHGVAIPNSSSTPASAMESLIKAVSGKQQPTAGSETVVPDRLNLRNVVLLIDEHDFPILSNLGDEPAIRRIQESLHRFYAAIKYNIKYLRFMFVTGIMTFKELSFFSAFETVNDISYNPRYAAICGFTEDEITKYYNAYLESALDSMIEKGKLPQNSTVDSLMKLIVEWYDGYSWDGQTKVFNPYSIKSFLEMHKFDHYWYNSGDSISKELFKDDSLKMFDIFKKDILIAYPISVTDPHKNLDMTSFLLQAGYLTVDSIRDSSVDSIERYHLKIPNKELKSAILNEISSGFLVPSGKRYDRAILNSRLVGFYRSLCSLNYKDAQNIFSAIMSRTPKTELLPCRENALHLILSKITELYKFPHMDELISDNGWADIIIPTFQGHLISAELKYARATFTSKKSDKCSKPECTKRSSKSDIDGKDAFACSTQTDIYQDADEPALPIRHENNIIYKGKGKGKGKGHKINSFDNHSMVRDILLRHIEMAFTQILVKNSTKLFLEKGKELFAAAVAVYDTSDVMIRFGHVGWKDDLKDKVVLTAIPDRDLPLRNPQGE
ncbi:MAG: AAA family ATPase [Deltaproteobacteria bacterium]|jgi:hypothetical protein|nr:AAA family ATPase [Deltaproteobacteria bacterium]